MITKQKVRYLIRYKKSFWRGRDCYYIVERYSGIETLNSSQDPYTETFKVVGDRVVSKNRTLEEARKQIEKWNINAR